MMCCKLQSRVTVTVLDSSKRIHNAAFLAYINNCGAFMDATTTVNFTEAQGASFPRRRKRMGHPRLLPVLGRGDRRTNRQTNGQHYRVKSLLCGGGLMKLSRCSVAVVSVVLTLWKGDMDAPRSSQRVVE